MLLRKTVVRFGLTFLLTHLDHVVNTFLYAIGRSISSYSVSPRSKDPRLHTNIPQTSEHELDLMKPKCYVSDYLQDFHSDSVHPPYVSVEDQIVNVFPVLAMFLD